MDLLFPLYVRPADLSKRQVNTKKYYYMLLTGYQNMCYNQTRANDGTADSRRLRRNPGLWDRMAYRKSRLKKRTQFVITDVAQGRKTT
jgi:hypothetical protein